MGANYTAYAIIGIEVPVSGLFKTEEIWHSKHVVPEGASYCPICGEKVVEIRQVALYDEDSCCIGSFKLHFDWDEERAVLGYRAVEQDYYYRQDEKYGRFMLLPNIDRLKQSLREHLEPLGLWDESKFGLHALLDISI